MKPYCFFLLILLFAVSCQPNGKKQHPNVVIILTDDQGWGDLSVNGNTNLETPHIDKLAASGITFTHFYVCPVCSPTRAELLTGRYHPRSGVYSTSSGGERMDTDETTIANLFNNAGYATAAYGKWHNGMQAPYHPNTRGFDDFYGFCSGHWGDYFSPMLEHNGEIVTGNGFIIDDLTNHGINFIEKNKTQPFFLYLPFNSPHAPMQVPEPYWEKFKDRELTLRNRDPEVEDLMYTRSALAMCENIDYNVGRVMKKLEETGLMENTIVIYLSDNGPNGWRWNGGMKGKKGSTDEGGVRSPMFIQWKGTLEEGKKITQIAGAIDLLPTLADLAGIQVSSEKPLDGVSLKPLLTSGGKNWKDRYLFNYWNKKLSVRNQKFRLDNTGKLFDMENDPGQHNDVSLQYPEIKNQMEQARVEWKNSVLSELPATDIRTFPIGYPGFPNTQIPARDATPHGNIRHSSVHPNCSFLTGWISLSDSITWNTEVLTSGNYEVTLYYTCPEKDTGAVAELSFGTERLAIRITDAWDPPLTGMENDRIPRWESYIKDFKPLPAGVIRLEKGTGTLTLKALEKPGASVMDFRLMMLRKIAD